MNKGIYKGKTSPVRPRHRWENIIKMDVRRLSEGVDCINLPQDNV